MTSSAGSPGWVWPASCRTCSSARASDPPRWRPSARTQRCASSSTTRPSPASRGVPGTLRGRRRWHRLRTSRTSAASFRDSSPRPTGKHGRGSSCGRIWSECSIGSVLGAACSAPTGRSACWRPITLRSWRRRARSSATTRTCSGARRRGPMGWKDVTPSDEVSAADWIGGRLLPFRDARIGSVNPTGFEAYVRRHQRLRLAALLARHTTTPERCWFCLWDGYSNLHGWPAVAYLWASDDPHAKPPPPPPPPPPLGKSRVRLPHRDYLLFTGAAAEAEGWEEGPNLWWPDDRSWCVASEIDLDYTLIGGSRALCAELIRSGAEAGSPDDRN